MNQIDVQREFSLPMPSDAGASVCPILVAVLRDFHRRTISCCYWKSSRSIPAVLAGESDLDLLVAREDQHRCRTALLERGLKPFQAIPGRDHPAIQSFLGYDELTGRLVHVHLHFRLVAGERLLKNYRLPWEDVILARAIEHQTLPIRILDPASEALLLVIRGCLELRLHDPVFLRHQAITTNKYASDRAALSTVVTPEMLRTLAAELLNDDLAAMIVDAFFGEHPLGSQSSLRRRLEKHLSPYRTYNTIEAQLRAIGRRAIWLAGGINRRLLGLPRPWARLAPGGGAVVSIIGIDGSGKSTAVRTILTWLGAEVDCLPMYFGTGDGRSVLLVRLLKLVVPLYQRLVRTRPKGSSHGQVSDRAPGLLYQALLTLWAMTVAREKRGKLLAARRGASRGLIILTDRYPQNEIPGFNDGPLLDRLSRVPQWLRRREASTYELARRLPPDLVIKLRITPATAQLREPSMDPSVIRERIDAIPCLDFAARRVVTIDAEQPLNEVIRRIKHEIWHLL